MSKNKKRNVLERRRSTLERIFFGFWYLILAIWSVVILYMFFWAITSALKTNLDYIREPLQLPGLKELQWSNFRVAIEKLNHNGVGFVGMTFNSFYFTIVPVVLNATTVYMVGYVFAQYDFKGKEFLYAMIIFTMVLPIYGSMAAGYKLIYDLGWNDSPLYVLQAIGGIGGSAIITSGFYKGVSRSYREAVYMDGGSHWQAFLHIGLPMGKSIWFVYFLLGFIGTWNDYNGPILYLDKMPTLASGLFYFQQEIQYEANNPAYFAGSLMTMIPILILFIFFADKIMGKMHMGGLKE